MTDDEQTFHFTMSGGGTPRGGLQDPSSVSVHLDPALFGEEKGRAMFGKAVEQQQAALTKYAGALEVAGGDVTAPDVQDAATNLHAALQFLPIAHTAYAGVAFPTARADDPAPKAVVSPTRGEGALGVHPDMLTAIQGDLPQRWELASEEALPLSVEVALATDPEPQVRTTFLVGSMRSRTVILLMEDRERDPDVLGLLAQQTYASPERKFPLPFADLVPRELDGLYELLGLEEQTINLARERWARAQDRRERITVGDALREIGWDAEKGSTES